MLSPMAAITGRRIALVVAFLLAATACSNADDDTQAELDAAAEAAVTSTTAPPSSTTTTEPTSTTLSDLEQAEAEIRQVVTEWYQFPLDYSLGDEGLGLEQTTGLLRQRIIESAAQLEAEGQTLRSTEPSQIQITGIDIDLAGGAAEAEACTGSGTELVDTETLEVINSGDASETLTSVFQLRLVDGEWKIYEWLPSVLNGGAIECEIET